MSKRTEVGNIVGQIGVGFMLFGLVIVLAGVVVLVIEQSWMNIWTGAALVFSVGVVMTAVGLVLAND